MNLFGTASFLGAVSPHVISSMFCCGVWWGGVVGGVGVLEGGEVEEEEEWRVQENIAGRRNVCGIRAGRGLEPVFPWAWNKSCPAF